MRNPSREPASIKDPSQTPISGGSALAKTLVDLGVHDVFALHGGHLDAFLVACPEHGIRLIDTRHEATAGHAADAYARAAGGVGVAVITAGPGFTNALTPMVSAYLDAIPTLFIAGAPPLREAETNPLQGGFDQVAMATPATKWAHRITSPDRIPARTGSCLTTMRIIAAAQDRWEVRWHRATQPTS